MALNDHKLTNFSFKHKNQPDRPNMTSAQFKAFLDSQGEELQAKHNSLIDELIENGAVSGNGMLKTVYDTNNNGIVDQAESVPFSGITGKPTTRAGYGITDAAPLTHTHPATDIIEDSTHRFVTDAERNTWHRVANGGIASNFKINSKLFIATAGQTVFDITGTGTYEIGKGHMKVYVGNVRQYGNFAETSTTSITMNAGIESGVEVYLEWFEGVAAGEFDEYKAKTDLLFGSSVDSEILTRDSNGVVTGFQATNSSGMLTNTTWTFNPNGTLNTVTEVVGTETITSTMNYTNGNLTSISKILS